MNFFKLNFFLFIMFIFYLRTGDKRTFLDKKKRNKRAHFRKCRTKDKNIFVFVHGTTNLKYLKKKLFSFSLGIIYGLFLERIDKIYHDSTIKNRWKNKDLNKYNYIMGLKEGLYKIEPDSLSDGAFLTLEWFEKIYKENFKEDYDFYVFNWSGLIYNSSRIKESEKFYNSLLKLKEEYLEKGINLKINIISYSHGGNVASLLGGISEKNNFSKIDFIETLVLLGTPVTNNLKEAILLKNKGTFFFKKVFNIYSERDYIKLLGEFIASRRIYKNIKDVNREDFFQIKFKYLKKNNKKHDPSHSEFVYYTTVKNNNIPVFVVIPIFLSENFRKKIGKNDLIEVVLSQELNKVFFYEERKNKIIYEMDINLFFDDYIIKAKNILKKNVK